jgi:hypothetical protein
VEETDTLASHKLKGGRLGESYLKNPVRKPYPLKYFGGIQTNIMIFYSWRSHYNPENLVPPGITACSMGQVKSHRA